MFAITDENMETEGDKLTIFLNSCFKQTTHVTEVKKKLDNEGLDYDDLFEFSERDLRGTLKDDLRMKTHQVAKMVKKLRDIPESGCHLHPIRSSGMIVLTEKHNNYLLKIQDNTKTVKGNIDKLKVASDDINKNREAVTCEVNKYYTSLSDIMKNQQHITLSKLETVADGKLSMIKSESVVANEALQHLRKSDSEFNRLLHDEKLDITKKHGAITQHIDTSQQRLVKYEPYLDKDMPLPTETKIEYDANETQPFKLFMDQIDNIIDADISFTKIEFMENEIIISWKSDLDKKENAKFMLQFKELKASEDEQKQPDQWRLLQYLKPQQTKVVLDTDCEVKDDEKEEKRDVEKDDGKEVSQEDTEVGTLGVLKELTMYQFCILVTTLTNKIYSKILIVTTPQFKRIKTSLITKAEEKQLIKWIPNSGQCTFKLLYRASRDGFTAAEFHKKCDGQGANVSIIRSNHNHIFGGYTTQSWYGPHNNYIRDEFSFLYLLRSSKGDQPELFPIIKREQNAIYSYNSYGPTYGNGHDLYIANNCNSNTSSYAHPKNAYTPVKNNSQLAGAYNFTVTDYEVWQVVDPLRDTKIKSGLINEAEANQLMKWIPNTENRRFRLLHRLSIHGNAGSTFHLRCDGSGPTISIIQTTTNHVFGGYTQSDWKNDNQYGQDDNAWLYGLRNANGNRPKKYEIYQNKDKAMYHHSSYGPTYGNNHDLYIANQCSGNNSSYTNLGAAYKGKEDQYQLNGGTYQFQVKDYEVWQVILNPGTTVLESNILNDQECVQLCEWVKESGNKYYKLLLRGSVDGFAASTFHQKCDGKGKTLVIIRSETNYVFGGYTEESWKNTGNYKPDANAWIYLLRSANGDQPEKWKPTQNTNSIYAHSSYCPTFGNGHVIYLANNANNNTSSYAQLGATYSAATSETKLAGAKNFKATEYEVWRVC